MNNLKMQSATSAPNSKFPSGMNSNTQLPQNQVSQSHVYSRSTSRPKDTNLQMMKLTTMLGKSTGVIG